MKNYYNLSPNEIKLIAVRDRKSKGRWIWRKATRAEKIYATKHNIPVHWLSAKDWQWEYANSMRSIAKAQEIEAAVRPYWEKKGKYRDGNGI